MDVTNFAEVVWYDRLPWSPWLATEEITSAVGGKELIELGLDLSGPLRRSLRVAIHLKYCSAAVAPGIVAQ